MIRHTPEHKRAIDDEIESSEPPTLPHCEGPVKALAEVEHGPADLKARDPGLARDCAHRLMALIAKRGWSGRPQQPQASRPGSTKPSRALGT